MTFDLVRVNGRILELLFLVEFQKTIPKELSQNSDENQQNVSSEDLSKLS